MSNCRHCTFYLRHNVYKHPVKNYGGCSRYEIGVSGNMKACKSFIEKIIEIDKKTGKITLPKDIEERLGDNYSPIFKEIADNINRSIELREKLRKKLWGKG